MVRKSEKICTNFNKLYLYLNLVSSLLLYKILRSHSITRGLAGLVDIELTKLLPCVTCKQYGMNLIDPNQDETGQGDRKERDTYISSVSNLLISSALKKLL